jgi:elongation factor G
MHANEMEEISEAGAGEICALFGVECYSGNTFTTGNLKYVMSSMHVPDQVISLSITPIKKDLAPAFNKALTRFQKEDPTFRVRVDNESGQTIISGMGELHLQIYAERLKREYGVETITGKPLVAFRETIGSMANFDYTHKKQSGGAGQFARVAGIIEPLPKDYVPQLEFVDETVGGSIPPHFMEAVRKGFLEGCEKGPMLGQAVQGIRMIVRDGAFHAVDSSDLAFKICASAALRDAMKKSSPVILEPIMSIEVQTPTEFQGNIIAQLNKRRGVINDTHSTGEFTTIKADVPLNLMFGYSTEVRSATQGKAEFTMEYLTHEPVPRDSVNQLVAEYNAAGRGGGGR